MSKENEPSPAEVSSDGLPTGPLIDAAEKYAEVYDGDERDCIKADVMNAFFQGAHYARQATQQSTATVADYEEALAGHRHLVRELDVIWNGKEGAAQQASLCDIVGQIKRELPMLRQSPARVEGELTDEQIREIVRVAVSEDRLSWLGYDLDENERYTIPSLSPCHYQLARAIERALNQRLAVKEGDAPRRLDTAGILMVALLECRGEYIDAFRAIDYSGVLASSDGGKRREAEAKQNHIGQRIDQIEFAIERYKREAQSTHPVSDDQQAKDAARPFCDGLRRAIIAIEDIDDGEAPEYRACQEAISEVLNRALSTTKQEEV